MPIAPEFRHHYRGPAWQAFRATILERAGGRCEFCGKPYSKNVIVTRDGTGRWNREIVETLLAGGSGVSYLVADLLRDVPSAPRSALGKRVRNAWEREWFRPGSDRPLLNSRRVRIEPTPAEPPDKGRVYVIRPVLTIAHLNHVPGDDREDNAAALCEFCHLHYDQEHHRQTRAARKDARRPILRLVQEARG